MREAWVALCVVAALALAWRLGLAPAPAGLVASAGSAVGLGRWQAARLVGRPGRPVTERDRSDAGPDNTRGWHEATGRASNCDDDETPAMEQSAMSRADGGKECVR